MNFLTQIRKIINPPYSRKDLVGILGVLVILVAIPFTIVLSLQRPSTAPRASTSATFTQNSDNGFMYHYSSTCPASDTLRFGAITGDSMNAIGRIWSYSVTDGINILSLHRFYLTFDTSSLPDAAIIDSVSLSLRINSHVQSPGANFDIRVVRTNWGAPPLDQLDWDSPEITTDGSYSITLTTPADGSWFTIPLNAAGINKAGVTQYKLKSSNEDAACASPDFYEYVRIYASESGSKPYLLVNYHTPPQPPQPKPPSTKPPSPGPSSGTLDSLQLEISVPYLVGGLKAKAEVGGVSKDIEISGSNKSYTLDLKGSNLSLNKEYTLVVTSGKTLIRKTKFTPTTSSTTVKVADLILGDINQDNSIDSTDQVSLVDSIASQTAAGDLNADTATNSMDWAILLSNFGKKGD